MLLKACTKSIYEMLSCCGVIRGFQNIFKLLTDDSMAEFGQMSLVPSLMDEIFHSSNLSLVPPLDELIKILQYFHTNVAYYTSTISRYWIWQRKTPSPA